MAAEASKLLKGVDAVDLHLAKTTISSDAILSEAPNVGTLRSFQSDVYCLCFRFLCTCVVLP